MGSYGEVTVQLLRRKVYVFSDSSVVTSLTYSSRVVTAIYEGRRTWLAVLTGLVEHHRGMTIFFSSLTKSTVFCI